MSLFLLTFGFMNLSLPNTTSIAAKTLAVSGGYSQLILNTLRFFGAACSGCAGIRVAPSTPVWAFILDTTIN